MGARAGVRAALTALVVTTSTLTGTAQAVTPHYTGASTVITAGWNGYGQLGYVGPDRSALGDTSIIDAVAIAAGDWHTVAIRYDGTVMAWGNNGDGQLGDGTQTSRTDPVSIPGAAGATAVAAGSSHTLALMDDGTLKAWGDNGSGQLGDGTTTRRLTPVAVPGLTNVVAIAAGDHSSYAVLSDGRVMAWGDNASGQLGNGTTTASSVPTEVALGGASASDVAAGTAHAYALMADGSVQAWGAGGSGQMGDTQFTPNLTPNAVSGIAGAQAIAAGDDHGLAVMGDGTIRAWGNNASGQLGDNTTTNSATPVTVHGITDAIDVAAGYRHSLAIHGNSTLAAWGDNSYGKLGDGTTTERHEPVEALLSWRAGAPGQVISISGGAQHTAALAKQPYITTAPAAGLTFPLQRVGDTSAAQTISVTSSGEFVARMTIRIVGPDADQFTITDDDCPKAPDYHIGVCQLSIRHRPTIAGTVHAALRVESGSPTSPNDVPLTGSAMAPLGAAVSGGRFGQLLATGANGSEQLGLGLSAPASRSTPAALPSMSRVVSATAGEAFSAALDADGGVWAWGANSDGQLGDGTGVAAPEPRRVPVLSDVTAITAGSAHTLALRADGTVWAWGSGASGKLGTGSNADARTPTRVPSTTTQVAVAAGQNHSLMLRRDGTVGSAGSNTSGQLGDGTLTSHNLMFQIPGLTDVVAVAAGGSHSLAVKADGTVWAWGLNSSGQLGDGTTTTRLTPTQVPGLTDVVAVAAGNVHSLALRSDGTIRAWGAGGSGRLGNGSSVNSLSPVAVTSPVNVRSIAAGLASSYAVRADGSTWAWGSNAAGQLGDGTTTTRTTPVQMPALNRGGWTVASGPRATHALIVGAPRVSLSTMKLVYTALPAGSSSTTQPVTITNTGADVLKVSAADIVGADGDVFTKAGDACTGQSVAPGATCRIFIRYRPLASNSPLATLRITSNSPTSPDNVELDPPAYEAPASADASAPAPTKTDAPGAAATMPTAPGVTLAATRPSACTVARGARGSLVVRCTVPWTAKARRLTVRAVLRNGRTVVARAIGHAGGGRVTLRFARAVRAGRHTLVLSRPGTRARVVSHVIAVPR